MQAPLEEGIGRLNIQGENLHPADLGTNYFHIDTEKFQHIPLPEGFHTFKMMITPSKYAQLDVVRGHI